MKVTSVIGLERPLFGQSVRQVVGLRSELLEACLEHQRQVGGRLGDILRARGLMTHEQIMDVLKFQARCVADASQADMKPHHLPYPAFFSLCMPAYNEQCNIKDTIDAAVAILPEFVRDFEIIVVNDGSKDGTRDIVGQYADADPRVRLVNHEVNKGYGAAVTSGLRASRGDLVAFTDSDGQFSLLDLPQLLAKLKGSDMVVGYRYNRADNWVRKMNAWGWNRLIRAMLGVTIQDLDCAFKVFRREVVDALRLTANGASINAEIMAQCCRGGLSIQETPVTHYPRYYGAPTGAALKVILKAFRELPRLWKYRSLTLTPLASSTSTKIAPFSEPTPYPVTQGHTGGSKHVLILERETAEERPAHSKHTHSKNGSKPAIVLPS